MLNTGRAFPLVRGAPRCLRSRWAGSWALNQPHGWVSEALYRTRTGQVVTQGRDQVGSVLDLQSL